MKNILLLVGLFFVSFLHAQGIEASIDKSTIKLGEPINYRLSVNYKKGDKIKLPVLEDTLSHHLEILSQKIDSTTTESGKQLVQTLQLTGYDAGEFTIPVLSVQKNNEQLKTKSFQIQIENVLVDTADARFYPIKPLMSENYTSTDYLKRYWLYGLAALVLMIIAIVLVVLYIRSKSKNLKGGKLLSPYDEALASLKALDAKKYLKKGEQKEYYTQLSLLLRRYIGRVYDFSALELLSDDLIQEIERKDDVREEDKKKLKNFLFDADLVKFAKHTVTEEKSTNYRQWIAEFVDHLKPLDIPENDLEDQVTGEKYHKFDNS